MTIISRKLYKTIEWHFFNYDAMRTAVENHRGDALAQAAQPPNSRSVRCGVGGHDDPTGKLGMHLAESPERLRAWIQVVNDVTEHYRRIDCTLHAELMRLHYKVYAGRNVQRACGDLHIDKRTFYRIKEDVVGVAVLSAVQRGLVKIF